MRSSSEKITNVQTAEQESTIDLTELAYRLLSNWKLIAVCAVAGLLLAFFFTKWFITPKYESTSQIYAIGRSDSVVNMSDLQIGSYLTKDYVAIFDVWEVHEKVINKLDLNPKQYSYSKLRSMISVSNPSDTRMIRITATSEDPAFAADLANTYASVACDFIAESMSTDRPNLVSSALVPKSPVSPSLPKNCAIGIFLGALLAAGFVTVQMLTDDKIKTPEDVMKYVGLTNIALIPVDDSKAADKAQPHKQK